jgi:hypothetical protein
MKTTLSAIAFISIKSSVVSPFSRSTSQELGTAISKSWSTSIRPLPTKRCREQNVKRDATSSSLANAEFHINTEIPITRISVCAGELCQCQGEKYEYTGGASDAAMKELQSFGLPFPVDEVACMVSRPSDIKLLIAKRNFEYTRISEHLSLCFSCRGRVAWVR